MVESKTKFILIQISPLILWVALILFILIGVLVFRKKAKPFIDYFNSVFWNYENCFVNGKSEGKALGKRIFFDKESIKIVSRHLFSSTICSFGPIIAVWWRTVLVDVKIGTKCLEDYDCFRLNSSYFEFEECIDSTSDSFICSKFSVPNVDKFITSVGVAYGFTRIMLSINKFILNKLSLFKIVNVKKRICIYIFLVFSILIILIGFGVAIGLSDKFLVWSITSIINYLIPFMILLSPIMAIIVFCRMNVKLAKNAYIDGILVYNMKE
jgi:hypothetical protein